MKWIVYSLVVIAVLALPMSMIFLESGAWTAWWSRDFGQRQPAGALGFHLFDAINCFLLFVTLYFVIRSVNVAEAALSKSHNAYVQSLVDSRYDAMDRLYFDLLKERRERPSAAGGGGAADSHSSDPYPLMVWNFIETVIDKCENDPSGELMRTWAPPISAEARNFGDWMLRDKRESSPLAAYFKNDFVILAEALVAQSREALTKGEDLDGVAFLRLYRALERTSRNDSVNFDNADFLSLFGKVYGEPRFRALINQHLSIIHDRKHDDEVDRERNLRELQDSQTAALARELLPFVRDQLKLLQKRI